MLPRLFGISSALILLVVLPPLIVRTVSPAEAPAPPSASLKIGVTGDDGGSGHPFLIRLRAKGNTPAKPSKLVDEAGLYPATLVSATGSCGGLKVRETNTGERIWCLKVSDVAAGHALSGKTIGGTALALTVTRRNAFWGWPLIVLLLGFAVALALPLLSKRLRARTQQIALERLLAQNKSAGAKHIIGLTFWVDGQIASGKKASEVLALIAPVVRSGPTNALKTRRDLRRALENTPLPRSVAYVDRAANEAGRTALRVKDFIDESGKVRSSLPAADWATGLKTMEDDKKRLDQAESLIRDNLKQEKACTAEPLAKLETARATFNTIREPSEVDDMKAALMGLGIEYKRAYDRPNCRVPGRDHPVPAHSEWLEMFGDESKLLSAEPTLVSAALDAVRHLEPPKLKVGEGGRLRSESLTGWLMILGAAVIVLGFAGVTVWQSAYVPKPAFAGFPEYFALFSAALASSAAGAVLGLLAYWQPTEASAES